MNTHVIKKTKMSQKDDVRPNQGYSIADLMKRHLQGQLAGLSIAKDSVYLDGDHSSMDMEKFSKADMVDQFQMSVEVRERTRVAKEKADKEKADKLERENYERYKKRFEEEKGAAAPKGGSSIEPVISSTPAETTKLG